MSLICRLATRKFPPQLIYYKKPEFITLARHVTLNATPYKPPVEEDHDDRNMRLNRPQSPHLSIYAPQLTSMLSATHRVTGVVLAGYVSLWGLGALVLPNQISTYIDALQAAHPGAATLFVLKFIFAFPFSYHFCNGFRHLTWDLGKALSIKSVYSTGYIMLGSTIAMTLALLLF